MSRGGLYNVFDICTQKIVSFLSSSTASSMLAQALSRVVPRRPRGEKKPIPDEQKDERYFERRKRNNLAAKKSRDQRKMREDAISLRASFLEKENALMRTQVSALRDVSYF